MNCTKCGAEIPDGNKFCESCGNPVETNVTPATSVTTKKPKKKRGCLIALLIFLGVICILIACVAIFLPGFFGPKNLGIKTSKEAYDSALTKLNYQKDPSPSTGSADDYKYTYGEIKEVKTALTSEELTSFINYNRPEYYAVKDAQIKINNDGSVEFSGSIDTDYFMNKVLGDEYTEEDIAEKFPFIKVIPDSLNVYAQFSGEISDNKSEQFEFSNIELMGVSLPTDIYGTDSAKDSINSAVNDFLASTTEKTGGTYDSIKVENGELKIDANLPTVLNREAID